MRRHLALAGAVALAAGGGAAVAEEQIGPWTIHHVPVSAELLVGGGAIWGWLNEINVPITENQAFSGSPLIADGFANGSPGVTVEVTFEAGVVKNMPGPDLVLFDARFSVNSYEIAVDYDGFSAKLPLNGVVDFAFTGVKKSYFYMGGGPFQADIMAAPIDLSFFGVPDGASVTKVRFIGTSAEVDPIGIGALVPGPAGAAAFALAALGAARRRR